MNGSTRRQWFVSIASACGLMPFVRWLGGRSADSTESVVYPIQKTDAEWRQILPPGRCRILRGHGTERPFSSPLDHETRRGVFVCAGCDRPLFSSSAKFDSGTGWPSFFQPLEEAVSTSVDTSWFMVRTEVHCASCGGHQGHVFPDGPAPTGLRYCINGAALEFVAS